jgi:cephalosporin hydroxylase/SAM-dependent methyltransferase
MSKRLTESNISECQAKFNLSYHVSYAYTCQQLVGFEGKDVLEVGGSLPKEFVLDYLNVKSWSAIETPDYEVALKAVGGLSHKGTIITDIKDNSNLGYQNRKLSQYNLFLENIENLPLEYYSKYDLVFSIAAFEHIQKFPLALEKMFLALKPGGQLFSAFSPIWSGYSGHHLPKITDQQGNSFDFGNSPIPPWGHLLMKPPELCQYLYQFTDKATADLIVYYVYSSPHINRFFTEDYIAFIKQSSFTVSRLDLIFPSRIEKEIQLELERYFPGRNKFKNTGILAILKKSLEKSSEVNKKNQQKNHTAFTKLSTLKAVSLLEKENLMFEELEQAQQFWNEGKFREAAELYRTAIVEHPELARAGFGINLAHSIILSANWKAVSQNMPQGINYLESSGWINSLMAGKPINIESNPLAWYTYPAIEFLENKINKNFRIFEFGSGNSTLWFAEKAQQVISVESDSNWFTYIHNNKPSNVDLYLIENEIEYSSKILEYPEKYFDIIVIDGINRNKCSESCINRLKEDGLIIFDNTDDRRYDKGITFLASQGFKRIDFYGLTPSYTYKNCTSIFFKTDKFLLGLELPSEKESCLGKSCFQITNPAPKEIKDNREDNTSLASLSTSNKTSFIEKKNEWKLKTPVCLMIFNRPDTTEQVFEAIRQAKPPKLLVIADGPRADRPGEAEKCAVARAIIEWVDWDCEVLRNYSDINLGCRKRVSSGLNWVFEQVEEAIILEDDCLPHPTFFRFCEELLERYRHDERIMAIAGNNFQIGRESTGYSYYFSFYNHIWGWASWRRAWRLYDLEMKEWPEVRESKLLWDTLQEDTQAVRHWSKTFQCGYEGFDTWDFAWTFACWSHKGLSILPNVTLVSNIGFGPDATHTKGASQFANLPTQAMSFPLRHPSVVIRDTQADDYTEKMIFSGSSKQAQTLSKDFLIQQAIAQLNANNNAEALSLLEQVSASWLELPGLNYGKAIAQARLGQIHEAVESLNRLLAVVPNHTKGKQLLAELSTTSEREVQDMLQQVVALLNQGKKVEALRLAEKAVSLGVFVPGMHYLRAVCLNTVGRHEEALEAAKQELVNNPYHTEARSQVEYLTKALIKQKPQKIPTEERSWGTTIPYELMMSIQNATHNYSYRGVPMIKNPFDFALYPLLIWNVKPRTIIEIGSKSGGSALWFGDLLDNFGIDGRVYSLDIVKITQVSHPRVTFLEGDGEALNEMFSAEFLNSLPRPFLVIEDAAHTYEISKAVLDFFHPYLENGEYIVIEDGIISDIVKDPSYSSGPHQALKAFLAEHKGEYEIDGDYCDFFSYNATWGTNGFLKKINNDSLATQNNLLLGETSANKAQNAIRADTEFQELLDTVRPYTSLSETHLYSIFSLAKRLCTENVPGNFIECGVDDGGSLALMAAVIKRYTKQTRWLYAFQERLTQTEPDKNNGILANASGWQSDSDASSQARVAEICSRVGVSDLVSLVKGSFQEILPQMRNQVGTIALLHINSDRAESTKPILHNLYERVVNDGCIQVDNYELSQECRQAIQEFEALREIEFDLNRIDRTGVWFSCPDQFPINPELELLLVAEFAEDDSVACGIQSQMSPNERFQLYYVLRQLLPETSSPLRFVEIGSFAGSSLFLTCNALKRITPQLQGFSVDPGGHPQLYEVLKHLQDNVTHLPLFSHQAVSQLQQVFGQDGQMPIFIFVDGNHTYEGVRQDIIDYFPLLAPGGIMMFHDYLPPLNDENRESILYHHAGNEPGIRQACQELMENTYCCEVLELPLLYPTDPTQTQAHLPIIPGVFSTIRAYRKRQS